MRIIGLGNNNRIGQSGSILGRFKKGVIVNAPVASGTLTDQSTLTGTGTVTYTTAGAFTGTVVSYSLTGATTGISINTSTGVVSVDRALVVPASPTLIITATNSGGSAQASFLIDIIPQAPASGDWTLVDSADGTGLTLDVLTVPVWTTSVEYAISGVWTSISASAPITIDVNNAPIGTPVSVTLRWGVGTIDGSSSVAKVATATVPANIVQYVANGTVGSAPANWTSRWATGAMTYQADPARLQLTTGNGVFWSLDSDSGRDLSAVSGEIDFSGTFVLNDLGEAEAGIGFWMNGTTVTSERTGFIAGIRENASVKQVALYQYTANSPTTLTTNTHGYNQVTGPGAAWTLRVRTRFISGTWRVYVKAWPNSVSEPIPWQIDAFTVSPSTTTGRIGIASRSASTGAPFSVMTLNIGLNGADAPGGVVAPGGSYKAGAALFVDLETGSDANPGTSSAAPLLTVPGNVDAGCVIKVRGRTRGVISVPNGSTSGAGRVTLLGNDPVFAAGNRATITGETDMTAMTNIGGNIWSGALPSGAWSLHPDTKLPYVEAIMYFRNSNTRMRLAQYPTQSDLNNDQIFTNMFPLPLANVTNSKNFIIPNTALSTIPNATIRAQVIADYPSATTIRDVVNAMHTAEALTVNSWFLMWGNHNTRQKGRISSYNPATGEMVLTDGVTVWSPGKDTYFSIMNHPSAIKMENQFIAGTASGQFKMMSPTNPNGQVTYAQAKLYAIEAFRNYTTVDGFIVERVSCPAGFSRTSPAAPILMSGATGAGRTGMVFQNNIVRLCSVDRAAILCFNPVDSVFRSNVIEDIFGRGSLITGGSKCVIVGNTFARTSFTAFSVRYTTDYVVAGNIVNGVIGTHSDLGSLYEDNKRLTVVGNRLTLVEDLEALNPGLTFHRFDDCLMAFNEILVPNVAGLQQWVTSGPRSPTSGSNRYSNNTSLHINPDRASNQNKSFNITSLANGQSIVTNNLTNALCFDAFEDAALTYGDPSFAWREVTANSATVSGSVTKADHTPKHDNPSILGNAIADSVNLVFSDVNAYVDIVIPSWGTAAVGAGVDSYIDLRQPVLTGRKIPAINGELIVTTTAGLLPTGTATWSINTTANADTSNGKTWQTGNTIRVLGQTGATVTTVTLRLRPGAGFVAGVADSVLISRPRAWRDRAERLSRRRYNLTVSSQYGSSLDTLDRFTGVVSPLKNTVGPLPGNYDLAPRELSPGVLAEPKLAEGDAWTFSPAAAVGMTPVSVTWTGAVRPDGTRVDCTNVNWWGLGLSAPALPIAGLVFTTGNSHMDGRDSASGETFAANVYEYNQSGVIAQPVGAILDTGDVSGNHQAGDISPMVSFANALSAARPDLNRIVFVGNAQGSTGFVDGTWSGNPANHPNRLTTAVSRWNAAKTALEGQGFTVQPLGAVHISSNPDASTVVATDANVTANALVYQNSQAEYVDYLRSNLNGVSPTFPVIVSNGMLSVDANVGTNTQAGVSSGQGIPFVRPYTWFMDPINDWNDGETANLPVADFDGLHANRVGEATKGRLTYAALARANNNTQASAPFSSLSSWANMESLYDFRSGTGKDIVGAYNLTQGGGSQPGLIRWTSAFGTRVFDRPSGTNRVFFRNRYLPAQYTISTRVRFDSLSAAQGLFMNTTGSGSVQQRFFINATNFVAGNAGQTDITTAHGMSINTTYNLAVTYDGTNIRAYKDGVLLGSAVASVTPDQTRGLYIGCQNDVFAGPFLGDMQWAAIYNTALSSAQLADLTSATYNRP